MSELLPCPFCGGEAQIQHQFHKVGYDILDWYGVYCHNPFCAHVCGHDTEAEAIEAWNTRAERTCENINEQRNENGVLLRRDGRIFKCSECGFRADDFYGDDEQGFPRFCPNCGAKVVGE